MHSSSAGNSVLMHASVQVAHAPDEGKPSGEQEVSLEHEKPLQERPKYCNNPGQEKFVKRMLADLVTQKAQRAASAMKGKESSGAQQKGPSQGVAPPSGSSDSKAGLKQSAPNQNISPANAMSSGTLGLQQDKAPQNLPPTGALHQSSSQQRPGSGQHGSSNGMHGAQQCSAIQTSVPTHMSQQPVPAPLNDRDKAGYHHTAPGQRPVPRGAYSSAGPDRPATRQSKLPLVPGMPNASPRYKTILCKHHREGRCPRGDSCFFAHGHAELRKLGGVQVCMLALPSQPSRSHAKQASICLCDAAWMEHAIAYAYRYHYS